MGRSTFLEVIKIKLFRGLKNAVITENECIDFCFISEAILIQRFCIEDTTTEISIWDIDEILFCVNYIKIGNCEIHFSSVKTYIRQVINLSKKGMKDLYI